MQPGNKASTFSEDWSDERAVKERIEKALARPDTPTLGGTPQDDWIREQLSAVQSASEEAHSNQ